MSFIFLVLLFCFFLFLYILYLLSHGDFVVLRSNASMEKIFNVAFLSALFSLFIARLTFVIFNSKPVFFSLLGFLLFPYFPGLSLMGAVIGGYLISLFIFKSKSLPVGRLMDFFSIAFLVSFPFGLIGSLLFTGQRFLLQFWVSLFLYAFIILIFLKFFLTFSLGGKFKDGSLSLLFMFFFPLYYFFLNSLNAKKFLFNQENIIALLCSLVFISIFVYKEKFIEKFILKKQ